MLEELLGFDREQCRTFTGIRVERGVSMEGAAQGVDAIQNIQVRPVRGGTDLLQLAAAQGGARLGFEALQQRALGGIVGAPELINHVSDASDLRVLRLRRVARDSRKNRENGCKSAIGKGGQTPRKQPAGTAPAGVDKEEWQEFRARMQAR
jgi:hypothetical protein